MKSLLEKFYTAYKGPAFVGRYDARDIDLEIFLNPSSKELLRDIEDDARAYLRGNGDLFVASSTTGGEVIHADLLALLRNEVPPAFIKKAGAFTQYLAQADSLGICLVRVGESNTFKLAESYLPEEAEAASDELDSLFDRASLKNPGITFSKEVKELI